MSNNAINSPSLGNISGTPVGASLLVGTSGGEFKIGSLASSGGTITITNPSDGVINLEQSGGSTGDVVGPSSSVDQTISRFNGTTGKIIQGSGVSIDNSDNLKTPALVQQICFPNTDYVSSTNIFATDMTLRVVTFNPVATGQTFSFSNASSINAAAGGMKLNTSYSCKFVNKSNIAFNLSSPFGDVSTSGMPTLTVGPKQTFDLEFRLTQVSPPLIQIIGGSSYDGGLLASDNVFTGSNIFSGHITQFDGVNTIFVAGNGPMYTTSTMGFSAVATGLKTTNSFTLTASEVAGIIVRLNGSLSTQQVFMPTAANFDAQILASYPAGGSVPTFTTYHLRVINESTTATATMMANTNFLISNTTISTISPQTYKDFLINKTSSTPEYTLY